MPKQTAIEFLLDKYKSQNTLLFSDDFEQAIEMEKEQIENAFNAGVNSEDFFCPPFEISESEKYYNQTYKSE